MRKITVVLFAVLLISGCGFAEFEDVSGDARYSSLIGQEFVLRSDALIIGVTLDPNYKKTVDRYRLTVYPGFAGPEVVSTDVLPIGTKFRIERVERCTNCYLDRRVELVVRLTAGSEFTEADVRLNAETYSSRSDTFSVLSM